MKKLLTVVTALLLGLAVAAPAQAATERIYFEGYEYIVEDIDPGRSWVSENGILHIRGAIYLYETTGDSDYYVGDNTVVVNINLDLATGMGNMWGTSDLVLDAYDGGFFGHWVATFDGVPTGAWTGQGRTYGYGEVSGLHQQLDLIGPGDGTDTATGFTMIPGGRN